MATSTVKKQVTANQMDAAIESSTEAALNEVAFNYAYMTMQAELRDVQSRLDAVEASES